MIERRKKMLATDTKAAMYGRLADLKSEIEKLRANQLHGTHETTIAYLINSAETLIGAASCLIDIPEETGE